MDLSLRFEDNKSQHDDLVLRLGERVWVVDSYYLSLDNTVGSNSDDASRVRAVLQLMLERWLVALQTLPEGETVYLPYDFDDEDTGWLRFRRDGVNFEVCAGRADVPGYSFSPSSIGAHLKKLRNFRPEGEPVRGLVESVIRSVRDSISAAS
jgi:hypothetical protein